MLKKLLVRKSIFTLVAVCILFAWVSWLSLSSIKQLQGNARVINYIGIVRGATQRLVKQELQNHPNDALVARLDSIVNELISGVGPNNLISLPDSIFQGNMEKVKQSWSVLKGEIGRVRAGGDNNRLFTLSEEYFVLVDNTVSSAEVFTENQVHASTRALWAAGGVFGLVLVAGLLYYLSTVALRRRAELLGTLAFTDQLTKLPNRAACDRELERLAKQPPHGDVAMFMFDMNNLKRTNDLLGHGEGDHIIAAFARCLEQATADRGFVGRYGGDEFVTVFQNADDAAAQRYIEQVNELVAAFNRNAVDELKRISFAAGYSIGSAAKASPEELLSEADKHMYGRKRQMKEAVLESIMDRVANASRELVHVAGAVYGASQELAEASARQRAVFDKFSEAAVTLRRHAEDYDRSAGETSSIIGEIQRKAGIGNVDMDSLARSMDAIAVNSKEINAILKAIDMIAFQTNILSLNAAVEAARAGRYGKGFSVVAEEVRSLANRSALSVVTTTDVLKKSNDSIVGGLKLSQSTTTHLQEIERTSRNAGTLMSDVAAKAKNQKDVLSVMVDDLKAVESIADRNSHTASVNADAAERLLRLARHMHEMLDFGQKVREGPDGVIDLSRMRIPIGM